jgi:purine-nucleoside phosphorylase
VDGPTPDRVVRDAVDVIRASTGIVPRLALVLGSGLNDLADSVDDATAVDTVSLPGWPRSTVEGHRGRLVFGRLEGCPVIVVQGRLHAYEGHPLDAVTLPVRLAAALGATHLLLTNAAGGIRPDFAPGTLMWIVDHIDWVRRRPVDPDAGRAPGAWARPGHPPWDRAWQRRLADRARAAGVDTEEGTYLWTLGPSFETPAEIRLFARLGADAVGMSTVPEAEAADRLGLRVLGLSTITNAAAGITGAPLNHEEVLETGSRVRGRLERIIRIVAADVAAA